MTNIPASQQSCKKFGDIAKGLVLSAIDTCPNLETRRERIRIALNCGILTAEDAKEKLAIVERMAA